MPGIPTPQQTGGGGPVAGGSDMPPMSAQKLYETARAWGQAGRVGWRDVWAATRGEQWLRGLSYVEEQRATWQRSL